VSRPHVSVVMPFAGDRQAADAAIAALRSLEVRPGDELILVDNCGVVPSTPGVMVLRATGERSPAHARNVGAQRAVGEWILFLDADCRIPSGLIDAFCAQPINDDVGALAGEVLPAAESETLAARYAAARSFLSQRAHLAHPYRPRAVAANLLVRRVAFELLGGFYEGVRAAEDTDFSWRLQQAGWRLELRSEAWVEHRYRTALRDLRRQWRGYAAGRAWLARRYPGFTPQPALRRALGRIGLRGMNDKPSLRPPDGRRRSLRFAVLDALLGVEELAGLALSNRPARRREATAEVVLVADRFPARGDPLVEFARTVQGARVEAVARAAALDLEVSRELDIQYREDDGNAARAISLALLSARHPLRCARDRVRRRRDEPGLLAIAPAVLRLRGDPRARVHPLGGETTRAAARRVATLAGRELERAPRPRHAARRPARDASRS